MWNQRGKESVERVPGAQEYQWMWGWRKNHHISLKLVTWIGHILCYFLKVSLTLGCPGHLHNEDCSSLDHPWAPWSPSHWGQDEHLRSDFSLWSKGLSFNVYVHRGLSRFSLPKEGESIYTESTMRCFPQGGCIVSSTTCEIFSVYFFRVPLILCHPIWNSFSSVSHIITMLFLNYKTRTIFFSSWSVRLIGTIWRYVCGSF